ncbi:hypothetical protein LG314_12770 [Agrococcus terreus]|uniref:hypothetical protein n=1 Tax=Agrococcus terreus TaxID=574649 RepID=UPI00384CF5CC
MPDRRTASDADERLGAYLNEHLLGAEGGVRAFRAAVRTWEGTPHEAALDALADEVDRDRRDLARIIMRLGHKPAGWKRLLTGLLRTIGTAGPYNLLRQRRASTAQIELDLLTGAVRAKRLMWEALLELAEDDARHDVPLLRDLVARADHQLDELARITLATVRERFGNGDPDEAHQQTAGGRPAQHHGHAPGDDQPSPQA